MYAVVIAKVNISLKILPLLTLVLIVGVMAIVAFFFEGYGWYVGLCGWA